MAYSFLREIRFSRGRRKKQLRVSVIYLGGVEILCPLGDGICGSVQEIFDNCQEKLKQNLLTKRIMEIKDNSFELKTDGEAQEAHKVIYNFRRIIYCGVDGIRPKVLVFNYHHGPGEGREVYLTHAFLCETKSWAKKLAIAVAKYFHHLKYDGGQDTNGVTSDLLNENLEGFGLNQDDDAEDIELANI